MRFCTHNRMRFYIYYSGSFERTKLWLKKSNARKVFAGVDFTRDSTCKIFWTKNEIAILNLLQSGTYQPETLRGARGNYGGVNSFLFTPMIIKRLKCVCIKMCVLKRFLVEQNLIIAESSEFIFSKLFNWHSSEENVSIKKSEQACDYI